MNDELGAFDASDRTLRFARLYPHPVAKVRQAVSDADHLPAWFPQRVVGDLLAPGAELRFESTVGGSPPFGGQVLRVDPPHLLELLWGTDTSGSS